MSFYETERTSSNAPLPHVPTGEILEGKRQVIIVVTGTSALFCAHRFVILDKLLENRLALWRQCAANSVHLREHVPACKTAWSSKRGWHAWPITTGRAPQQDLRIEYTIPSSHRGRSWRD